MTTEDRTQLLNLRMTIDHLALCVQQFQLANQNVKEAAGQVTAAAVYAEWGATDKAAEATADFDWRWEEQQQAAINLHEARQQMADQLTTFIPLLSRTDLHGVAEITKTLF